MRLSIDEVGVNKFDLVESFDLFKAKLQKFRAFEVQMHPWRSKVPAAVPAEMDYAVSLKVLSDVNSGFQAVKAHTRRVVGCRRSADAA